MPEQMTNVFHKDASSEPPSTIKNSIWVCSVTEVPPPTIKNSIWVRV